MFLSDGGSEHLSAVDQTDTDDASRSRSSQLMPGVGGALQGLSPMILMNNVLLQQVNFSAGCIQHLKVLLLWVWESLTTGPGHKNYFGFL